MTNTKRTDEDLQALAARVRRVVEAIGTQAQAAEVAGVSLRHLKKYLAGEVPISARAAAALSANTGFSLDWLLLGDGPERGSRKTRDSRAVKLYAAELINDAIGSADAFTVLGLLVNSGLFAVYKEEGFDLEELDAQLTFAIARDSVCAFARFDRERWPEVAPAIVDAHRAALRHVRRRGQ
jgi:transcriptional regulator with XRE-family HTH domain